MTDIIKEYNHKQVKGYERNMFGYIPFSDVEGSVVSPNSTFCPIIFIAVEKLAVKVLELPCFMQYVFYICT